jgi:quinol monooxygenase YgiN
MIVNMIKIKAKPHKQKEMEQTLLKILHDAQKIKGCSQSHLYNDMEYKNAFCLVQEWKSQEDLDWYMNSDLFRVIKGAAGLLSQSHQITFKVLSDANVKRPVQSKQEKDTRNF